MSRWSDTRTEALTRSAFNVARLPPDAVRLDLRTDAGLSRAHDPESGSDPDLSTVVREVFGTDRFLVTGSGRGAESVVASLATPGQMVVANEVYVSGRWWLERFGAGVTDFPGGEASVAYVQVTAPRANLGPDGGLPVTIDEMQAARRWRDAEARGVPLVLDASRLWENAVATGTAASRFLDLADVVLLSAGKDLGAGRGGLVVVRDERWWEPLRAAADVLEGSDGGLDTGELSAIASGLRTVGSGVAVARRCEELQRLAMELGRRGVPVARAGAGSLFLDAATWLPAVAADELPAQTLLNLLYLQAGIRGLGTSTDELVAPGTRGTVRLAVRHASDDLLEALPAVIDQARSVRSGFQPRARDRAAPYLQPAEPLDPAWWGSRGVRTDEGARSARGRMTVRTPPGRGRLRALAHAMAATYPESLPDPTAPEGWDPAAWIEIGRIRRLFPAVGAGESARPPTSLPSGWATGVQPPLDDDGGQLVVARSSPVADALDAGSLFTLGAWFDLTAE